jgi:uncharacterized protein YidB (DUF937 family)
VALQDKATLFRVREGARECELHFLRVAPFQWLGQTLLPVICYRTSNAPYVRKLQKDIAMGLLDSILGGIAGNLGGSSGTGGMAGQGRAAGGQNNILMALLPVVLSMLANRGGAPTAGNATRGTGLSASDGGLLGGLRGIGGTGMGGMGGLGGLGALLELFQRKGYGDQARSWVGTGQNQPIAPDALSRIFGGDQLSQIASQAGVSEEEARTGLSALLPQVVDQLTPQGQLPDQDQLSSTIDDFMRQLQRT